MINTYEKILLDKRGYVSKFPENKKAVMIISGGLDSVVTSARLMHEHDIELFPLHVERGQTNFEAEKRSVEHFEKLFKKQYPGKFHTPEYIKLNVPPKEIKQDLLPYTKSHGHPLRDTMLQMAAVQYAASLLSKGHDIDTIFCAVMPEDYFPHSNMESIRATTIAICQNMGNWKWVVSSPNTDPNLTPSPITKKDEITWAMTHQIPVGATVSCNVATKDTSLLNCGTCSSCGRRKDAFREAGFDDPTQYFSP